MWEIKLRAIITLKLITAELLIVSEILQLRTLRFLEGIIRHR